MSEGMITGFASLGLFTGASQVDNFCRMDELLPSVEMAASSQPRPWPAGERVEAPSTFGHFGHQKPFEDGFVETETAALLLLHRGRVRYERYALTGGPDVRWISMSVAKSFVSALVGIAIAEGHIGGVDDPISDYIDVRAGSAYDGVSIRHVLQMASGARWNEEYSDPDSDVRRLGAAMSGQGTLEEFVASMVREHAPGTVCRYNSGDTQALGLLLVEAPDARGRLHAGEARRAAGLHVPVLLAGRRRRHRGRVRLPDRDRARLRPARRALPQRRRVARFSRPGGVGPRVGRRLRTAFGDPGFDRGPPSTRVRLPVVDPRQATAASSAPSASTTSSCTSIPRGRWWWSNSAPTAPTAPPPRSPTTATRRTCRCCARSRGRSTRRHPTISACVWLQSKAARRPFYFDSGTTPNKPVRA